MPREWSGPAALIDASGRECAIEVSLHADDSGDGWSGSFLLRGRVAEIDTGEFSLRLADGGTGDVLVSSFRIAQEKGAHVSGTLEGRGPAPF